MRNLCQIGIGTKHSAESALRLSLCFSSQGEDIEGCDRSVDAFEREFTGRLEPWVLSCSSVLEACASASDCPGENRLPSRMCAGWNNFAGRCRLDEHARCSSVEVGGAVQTVSPEAATSHEPLEEGKS
jgi:hypothetical protein